MPKKLVLHFPPHLIDQPITYRLIKDFGLVVNILRARITPREWGRMVVELTEDGGRWQDAMDFLAEAGVGVEPLAREVLRHEERCIHCTACVAPCPTKALDVPDRYLMEVAFDQDRCIACEICQKVCPYQAMEILFD
ncbi:MAG: 4Fe-4S dicluster domain-containing protein [Deltaproteobacteria bacterium]|nr:4Fe-4S dicluster domain-containing protein [Deltaproteobacteria bacterium]